MPEQKKIGAYVRQLMEEQGISYRQAEEMSGVSAATISRICNGAGAQMENVTKLVNALGGSLDGLKPESSTGSSAEHLDDLRRLYSIQLDSIIDSYEARIADIKAANEAHLDTARRIARQRLRWIIVLSLILAAVVVWFIWDLTHPEIGLIRLKQAGYIGRLLGMK